MPKVPSKSKEYHRTIFFTKVKLGGYYRYKDIFQIFPADFENMPKSAFEKHYPNILEYWTSDEDKIIVPHEFEELTELYSFTATTHTKHDKILALLSAFSNSIFFQYRAGDGVWGIPMLLDDPDEEANTWSSKWCDSMYYFPDLPRQYKIDKFSELKIPEIKRIPHNLFYTNNPNLDYPHSKEDIVLPSTIDQLFDSYYILEDKTKLIVDAAISYTVSAIELMSSRQTLSLLASFTSLETMVNLEFKDLPIEPPCPKCEQRKYSVSRKFREYLLKYIGDSPQNKRKFNSYYELRSKIVHTGRQLKSELLFSSAISPEEIQMERITRVEILQIGKLGITNWLLKRNP